MTRFVGDSVSARRKAKGYSTKDRERDLERFKETGYHAEAERIRAASGAATILPLPEPSTARQYAFLDLELGGKPLGRLVIELFDDVVPVAVAAFRNRCSEGASDSFRGTALHRLIADQAVWGGLTSKYREALQVKRYPDLRHCERGCVGVSLSGAEFCVTLERALQLDEGHQVVGRVSKGGELLAKINGLPTDPQDCPVQRLAVARCGLTNAQGTYEDYGETTGTAGRGKETAEEAAARLQCEAAEARDSVKEALQTGMGQKRKRPDQAAAAGGDGRPGAAGRRGMLDSVLGDISSGSEDEEGEEGEG
eukprot:scaffold16.g74.t1